MRSVFDRVMAAVMVMAFVFFCACAAAEFVSCRTHAAADKRPRPAPAITYDTKIPLPAPVLDHDDLGGDLDHDDQAAGGCPAGCPCGCGEGVPCLCAWKRSDARTDFLDRWYTVKLQREAQPKKWQPYTQRRAPMDNNGPPVNVFAPEQCDPRTGQCSPGGSCGVSGSCGAGGCGASSGGCSSGGGRGGIFRGGRRGGRCGG